MVGEQRKKITNVHKLRCLFNKHLCKDQKAQPLLYWSRGETRIKMDPDAM